MEFKEKLEGYRRLVESSIDQWLPSEEARPARLHRAMRHSMKAGGKRLRPVLVLASCELQGSPEPALPAAAAIECLHTYSLIHDDLPAIDDAALRRGQPTCHKQFDEATAILAGDALLTFAFQILGRAYGGETEIGMRLVGLLAEAAGSEQLIGGQMEDILGEGKRLEAEQIAYIHRNKTAAMIACAARMGAVAGGADAETVDRLGQFGRDIGLAFQIVDDLLDATGDAAALGKDAGADAQNEKATYVSLEGAEASREMARSLTRQALDRLAEIDADTSFLEELANRMVRRDR